MVAREGVEGGSNREGGREGEKGVERGGGQKQRERDKKCVTCSMSEQVFVVGGKSDCMASSARRISLMMDATLIAR